MVFQNLETPKREPISTDRSDLLSAIGNSVLSLPEKEEFFSLAMKLSEEMLEEVRKVLDADPKEALEGVRFHFRMEELTGAFLRLETRMFEVGSAVNRARSRSEDAERQSGAEDALQKLESAF